METQDRGRRLFGGPLGGMRWRGEEFLGPTDQDGIWNEVGVKSSWVQAEGDAQTIHHLRRAQGLATSAMHTDPCAALHGVAKKRYITEAVSDEASHTDSESADPTDRRKRHDSAVHFEDKPTHEKPSKSIIDRCRVLRLKRAMTASDEVSPSKRVKSMMADNDGFTFEVDHSRSTCHLSTKKT